ncbi:hypothetical protein Sjap_011668 [Stephania japonica]|uniref:Miraculin n=1 Tax=Stephania japonica TaxID=461633 RepID=A0AAP0JBS2_9MAGN
MTTSSSTLFALLILACAISAQCSPVVFPEVRDTTGKKLISGADYYIVPALGEGGLTLEPHNHSYSYCPLDVAHAEYDFDGMSVKFLPVNSKKGMIRVSTDLNIKFNMAEPPCDGTRVWKLASFDKKTRQYFVTTGGSEGNPGPETLNNWFKIEKYEGNYKLSYCPSVCKSCKVMCKDIGLYTGDATASVSRYALSKTPFAVMFKKA